MVRESRELECTGLILSSKEAALVTLLEDALSLLTDGRFEILYREVDKDTLAALLIFPVEKAAEARTLLWEKNIGELRLPASVAEKPLPEALEIIARRQAELPPAIREIEASLAGMARSGGARSSVFAAGLGTGSSGSARPACSTRPMRRSCSTAGFRKASWRDSRRRSRRRSGIS